MGNKGLGILGVILDIINIIIFIFSLFSSINPPVLKGVIAALSLLSAIAFSSIWALERFRKQEIEYLAKSPPPLDNHDIFLRTITSKNNAFHRMSDADIATWELQVQRNILNKNEQYLKREKILFFIGILFMVAIALYLFTI